MTRLAFYFDSSACSGCKACQMACKDKNDLPVGQNWRRVYEVTGGEWRKEGAAWRNDVFAYNLSISCNHCEDPICAHHCPTQALLKREDGIVKVDRNRCIGCKYCAWVCPYGAPQFDPVTGVMGKCDLCADYIDQGKNPSCVDACPMRVLDVGDYDHLVQKYGAPEHVHPMPDSSLTQPSIVVRSHPKAGGSSPVVANIEEVDDA
ncbi:MAG: dimethylsulfoxide reductase subunit B [Xanthomonadales bacterium]|nr:dimethylsulfoxide reductase subunit B [Gammaproteobacteria bacterium]MBT8050186.1 dimethylsulfoxide reductase subunit B [Gammaproteobacteria bacterium]MBT8055633.1 dimethylsulfoxide reductase subunit B [Gammaproteobacteria bacterium]NNJ79584.1 dimethylsulfoxide reductase subunit B [Xanthomonadales bacterium]NNL05449.1 dimethylsulfoxide reductase subunit B [Xanthomonadales bacterium]